MDTHIASSNDARVHIDRELLELVPQLDAELLERVASRLELPDLLVVTHFPGQPHTLIHHSLAALHASLLFISSEHTSASALQLTPWALLRLEMQTRMDAVWQKMWKRLAKLRRPICNPRRKSLAPSQIHFILRLLLIRVPLHRREDTSPTAQILREYHQLSVVAESLVAFCLLCVHHSLVPLASRSPAKSTVLIRPSQTQLIAHHTSTGASRKRGRTWRCGCKHGGRYFLYRASVVEDNGEGSLSPSEGVWSCHAIDRNSSVLRWQSNVNVDPVHSGRSHRRDLYSDYSAAWTRQQSIPRSITTLIQRVDKTRGRLSTPSHSLLLQAAFQVGLFDPPLFHLINPPSHGMLTPITTLHDPPSPLACSIFLTALKVTVDHTTVLHALGHASIRNYQNLSLSALRRQLEAVHTTGSHEPLPPFLFLINRTVVLTDDEPFRLAVELLPFAVLLTCSPRYLVTGANTTDTLRKLWHSHLQAATRLQEWASQALRCHPLRSDLGITSRQVEVDLFSVEQPFTPVSTQSMLSFFLDWRSFVQFQQLQNSTLIYQSPENQKTSPKKLRPNDSTGDVEAIDGCMRPQPTPAEVELLSLPHHPFRAAKEFLRPLYTTICVTSRSTGTVLASRDSTFQETLASATRDNPVRLVVDNEECVMHVTSGQPDECGLISFQRDRSCPVDMLLTFREAYVWQVVPLTKSKTHVSPLWLRDVLRVVTHPTYDFREKQAAASLSFWPFPNRFFRVQVPHFKIESLVEATFWSHGIDWQPYWAESDPISDLLLPKYKAMCQSHPPSFAIDSIKFSKVLRECGLQPTHLSVGDAAFLFTANRVPGSSYEMVFDGFHAAMQWIAGQLYTSDDPMSRLRRLCFDWLIRAPSMRSQWEHAIHQWRLSEKLKRMDVAARQYCAATRIRANWKRLVTRRRLIDILTRLKRERRAAAAIQSMVKMRRERRYYLLLKACAIQTQLFIRARRVLRQLRHERAMYVEATRSRLQKWMRQRLRVLRCWKKIHTAWLARRARIQEKRSRLVCAAAFSIEGRYVRVSLYRFATGSESTLDDNADDATEKQYDLEVLDPLTSWWRSIHLTQTVLDQLDHEAEQVLGRTRPRAARSRTCWTLTVIVQRLRLKSPRFLTGITLLKPLSERKERYRQDSIVQLHRDPIDTSLGRVLFNGSVVVQGSSGPLHLVRLLCRSLDLTLVTYSPDGSTKRRFHVTTSFVHRILQFTHYKGLLFNDGSDDGDADPMTTRHYVVAAITRGPTAMRDILQYLMRYGTRPPTRDMLPEEIARREEEQRCLHESRERAARQRLVALVIQTQANARRWVAIQATQRLALSSYTKYVDPRCREIVYRLQRQNDSLEYRTKPPTLRDKDVLPPVDEWLLNEPGDERDRYFNPLRGVYSRIPPLSAAMRLQRWFRRLLWTFGFDPWNLRSLTQALQFHHRVYPQTDPSRDLAQSVHYALQLHTLHRDFKQAQALYEAVLKIDPLQQEALVGMGTLLIYSCKYPAKQTWAKGLQLVSTAHGLNKNLAVDLAAIEQNCFRWATYVHSQDANALGVYAVYLQCVRGELDGAERLYRRAIDLDPSNECVIENYLCLQRERTPAGYYSDAGPSKIAVWRAQEVRVVTSEWRELEDTGARFPSAQRFFKNVLTGKCVWSVPYYY